MPPIHRSYVPFLCSHGKTNVSKPGFKISLSLVRGVKIKRKTESKAATPEFLKQLSEIPIDRYRNFSIAAHVDHGKSTLSDRLLEITGVIEKGKDNRQVLDRLDVERERGITVKAQTCTMMYNYRGLDYLLNLVDTPGHVDFRHEVARSYASCGGALLLVDASQGVQAQTVANYNLARKMGLVMVPIINKIDLPHADVPRVSQEIVNLFELENPIPISAKSGLNTDAVLPSIIERIPPPKVMVDGPLKALLVDSWFDNFLGVILLVFISSGKMVKGDKLLSAHTKLKYEVKELGIMHPDKVVTKNLTAGQIGYLVTGMKRSQDAKIGDTFMLASHPVDPLPGFEEVKPMVYVGAFPAEGLNFEQVEESIQQLTLNDRSVTIQKESSNALGQGWRLGFLGTLHASVFRDRLQKEHNGQLIFTAPTVPYKIIYKDSSEKIVTNPNEFPSITTGALGVKDLQEPYVDAMINCPPEFVGSVVQLSNSNRGHQTDVEYLPNGEACVRFLLPLAELVDDFFGKLKGVTRGYGQLDYEDAGYRSSRIVKLELLVNGVGVDSLARVMHISEVDRRGREWVKKLREFLRYQLFEVIIQARCGNRIIARETIKAKRKDVLAKLHASDISRRKKLLAKQKEGKKYMQSVGKVSIPQEAYQGFLSRD